MTSARLTPRYSGVIDSRSLAPVSPGTATGPQLMAADVRPTPSEADVAPAARVLSMLGRRPRVHAEPVDSSEAAGKPLVAMPDAPARRQARVVPVGRRPWRVLIVSAAPGAMPRSFEVSRWQARAALGALGLMIVLSGGVVAALGVAIRAPSLLGRADVQALEAELAATRDSLAWERTPEEDPAVAPVAPAASTAPVASAAPAAPAAAVKPRDGAPSAAPAPAPVAQPVRAPAAARPVTPISRVRTERENEVDDSPLPAGGVLSLVPRSMSDLPVIGAMVSGFSHARRHPLLHRVRPHLGVDLAAPRGTRVSAPAPGVVSFVGRRLGFGLVVELDHGAGVVTRYAHLRSSAVQPGETVRRGEAIAAVGTSGVTTGPHLHYEVMVHGRQVDPLRVRFGRAESSTEAGPVLTGHAAPASGGTTGTAVATGGTHEGAGPSLPSPPR